MIDWTKPIQTRDGRPAKLIELCHDGAMVAVKTRIWQLMHCLPNGCQFKDGRESPDDIINAPAVEPWIEAAAVECVGSNRGEYYAAEVARVAAIIAKHTKQKGAV